MKLLYFTIQINMVGGLAKIVIDKINWLAEQGYDITLCNIESSDICPAYPLDSRVERISANIQATPGGMLTRGKGVLAAIKRTKEIIAQVQPDIIVNAHCPLVTWILPFVHKDIPKIIEMHQSRQGLEVFNRQFLSPLARFVHRHATKWIYSRYERFVVLTHGDRDSWGCKNCIVIPNFHNFEVLADVPERAEYKQIIMLARLMPQKRIDLMIDVWAKLADDFPNWQVKVLGEGLLRQELERKIHSLGLDKVFLLPGEVNDVTKELQSSDVLCLTSEYEGFGIVLIEAMAKGIPAMAFEYVGVDDIIRNGADGVTVPFGDIDEYARQLRHLLEDKNLRRKYAKRALDSVKKFDKQTIMQQWASLFERIALGKGRDKS